MEGSWGQTAKLSWELQRGSFQKEGSSGLFGELGKGKLDFLVSLDLSPGQGAGMTEVWEKDSWG